MNDKNEQLLKIGLDVIKNCDDFFAIQKLFCACHERVNEIIKEKAIPKRIGYAIEKDFF